MDLCQYPYSSYSPKGLCLPHHLHALEKKTSLLPNLWALPALVKLLWCRIGACSRSIPFLYTNLELNSLQQRSTKVDIPSTVQLLNAFIYPCTHAHVHAHSLTRGRKERANTHTKYIAPFSLQSNSTTVTTSNPHINYEWNAIAFF